MNDLLRFLNLPFRILHPFRCQLFRNLKIYSYVLDLYRNMFLYSVLLVLAFCYSKKSASYEYQYNDPKLIVSTTYGKVMGQILSSEGTRSFYAYKGIPFAKPPVGSLRFRDPVPPDPWEDVLDATKDAPMCIQKDYIFFKFPVPVQGEEDCLYLNVYTPKFHDSSYKGALLPVMVFIHYGGFFTGTGNSDYLGPEYFMDKNVVLVTFNYRLGVFGFFSTNDDAAPGNWALKDQVAALRWVQENIAVFGGNPKKVTIFGESAGAGSSHLHLFSQSSRGLFHQCISESGSALAMWARPNGIIQAQITRQQAAFVNCTTNNTKTMVECVRNVDADTLADSIDKFKFLANKPSSKYGPVLEKKSQSNPEPFIENDPLTMLQSGNFNPVPWIVGVVEDEGILKTSPILRNAVLREALNASFNECGPEIVGLLRRFPLSEVSSTWKKITDFYLPDNYIDVNNPASVQGFIDMNSDSFFNYASYQSALLHALIGLNPVWFYKFNYRGEYSYGDKFAATTENINFNWGVSHTDELLYLFTSPALFEPLKAKNDLIMKDCLIQMWTDFAISGDPSPRNTIANLKWEPLANLKEKAVAENSDLNYLNIAGSYNSNNFTFEMRNDFLSKRMMFWKSLSVV